ncbi:MAG: ABC transporter ATP-binding protein [Erysipelothrix sp.]|nr:ABC transporter ATP-binding protein [Erysipelothrix sp.]
MKLLEVKNLYTQFNTDAGVVKAVDGVSFSVEAGKTIGIVGESGSGKSVTAMSVIRLLDYPGEVKSGEVFYKGKDLTKASEAEMRAIRGNEISVIFQEPMTSLNPVFTIKSQLNEAIILHQKISVKEATEISLNMLKSVKIENAEEVLDYYPHQLSGGMRQRVMIAMSLACKPDILIADEPTTALDVIIQAEILKLMNDLRTDLNTSIIFISHDLGVVSQMADDVIVMINGRVVEQSPIKQLFDNPIHPYTRSLISSFLRTDIDTKVEDYVPLDEYANVTDKYDFKNFEENRMADADWVEVDPGHFVAVNLKK